MSKRLGIALAAGTLMAAMLPGAASAVSPVDTTPPEISCSSVSPDTLWPPNHRLVEVAAAVTVIDDLDPDPVVVLQGVTSSEPDNAVGAGDGNTADDIQGWGDGPTDTTGSLRAERSSTGSGRVYTLVYLATDSSGNTASCSLEVRVPLDQRP